MQCQGLQRAELGARKREGAKEEGNWGRGVNSSLCGEQEKRESLLWYVYMSM